MVDDQTIRKVQAKLNRLSLYVLGCLLAKCGKDEFGRNYRKQVLLAMSPECDRQRLSDDDSFSELAKLSNGKWAHE